MHLSLKIQMKFPYSSTIIFRVFIINIELRPLSFSHRALSCLYRMDEVFALIWRSGLIIIIRGKRAV